SKSIGYNGFVRQCKFFLRRTPYREDLLVRTTSQPETETLLPRIASLPAMKARSVILCANPRAGHRSRHDVVTEIQVTFEPSGCDVRLTTDLDELAEMANRGASSGELRAVVATGGDGTASTVRNCVPLQVPLLPVPMGTENLLGRYVQQLPTPAAVAETMREG